MVRKLETALELATLHQEGRGYVFNLRPDIKRVHHVSCQAVEAMVTSAYPKYFSETAAEARVWLEAELGPEDRAWVNCGFCGGVYRQ